MVDPKQKSKYTLAQIDAALGNLLDGSPVGTNPNLLSNWYFINPVNQRGLTEYTGLPSAAAPAIDRWAVLYKRTTMTLTPNGITIGTTETEAAFVQQKIAQSEILYGLQVTLSMLVDGIGLISATGVIPSEIPSKSTNVLQIKPNGNTSTGLFMNARGELLIQISAASGKSFTASAIKLELGDTQTLAHKDNLGNWVLNEIPEYCEQLELCKWFFERISASHGQNLSIGIGSADASNLYVPIKISPKRAIPASFSAEQVANLRYGTSSLSTAPSSASIYALDIQSGMCTLRLTGNFTAGSVYRVGLISGASLDFDSNI